jgi:4a-hydroxytetrahydrobiopterin dehydratase
MSKLNEKKCIVCEGGNMKALDKKDAERLLIEVEGWALDAKGKSISKEFVFKNFDKAMDFVNMVADIAEFEGHHPDITILYNKVELSLSTHSIKGLSENDFIVAAKIDGLRL